MRHATKKENKMNTETKYHGNGMVTYWSVYEQRWIEETSYVPDHELAAMGVEEREMVEKHLATERERATDCTGIRGDCSGLQSNCAGFTGDETGPRGDCTGIRGDCSGLMATQKKGGQK
jgi:hypothetical protein